jgi:hypothetical protein
VATGARTAGVLFVSTILLPIGKDIASRNTTKKGQAMEGYPPLLEVLSTEDEIEAAIGKPAPRMLAKVVDSLDDICRALHFSPKSYPLMVLTAHAGSVPHNAFIKLNRTA